MTNLAAIWLVAKRELGERIRARSFVIITAAIVAISAGGIVAAEYLPDLLDEGPKHLGVTTASPSDSALQEQLAQSATTLAIEVKIDRFPDRSAGEAALRDGKVDALLTGENELVFKSTEDESLIALVNRALYTLSLPDVLNHLGLTYEDVRPLVDPQGPAIVLLEPDDKGGANREERLIVAQASAIVIYLAVVLYGQGLLTGVIEEKTSRVVEVLLGTLRPEQLLTGKVLGILAAVLTQMLAAILGAGFALLIVGASNIPSVALDVALASCVFFILGLLSYSFLYAMAGATVSRQSEAESAQMPISMILVALYLLSLTVIPDHPDGVLARILSVLPPTAPIAMPARVAIGHPLPVEIVASVALMFPWLLAVIWLAARVYTGAILTSGHRVGLLAAWRSGIEAHRD
jgi:ABC-2 type transport system permease protein